MAATPTRKKVVIVGDSYSGKSSMLFAFIEKRFVEQYSQTIFETYVAKVDVDTKNVGKYLDLRKSRDPGSC